MKAYSATQRVLISQDRPSKRIGLPSEPRDTEYGGVLAGIGCRWQGHWTHEESISGQRNHSKDGRYQHKTVEMNVQKGSLSWRGCGLLWEVGVHLHASATEFKHADTWNWGDDSVSKMLAVQARSSKFNLHHASKTLGIKVRTWLLVAHSQHGPEDLRLDP